MREALKNLNATPGMRGALLVSPDGLPIAVDLPDDMELEATAGLSAVICKMVEEWASLLTKEDMILGMLESQDARLFISAIDWGFVVAIAAKSCPLGEARLSLRTASARLNEICRELAQNLQEEESRAPKVAARRD